MPQVRRLADVKFNLLRPATTSNFEVTIPMDAVSQTALQEAGIFLNKTREWQLNLLCTEATLPGSSLQTYDDIYNDFTGATERYVHRRQYDEQVDFTFYVNADNYIPIRFFETWIDYIVGVETENERKDTMSADYFYRMNYPRGTPGTQTRRFTHIKDTINVCYIAWKQNKCRHYSISNKRSYSIKQIANFFKTKIKYVPSRAGERYASALSNISLSNKVYKYFGKIDIKQYITAFLQKY